MRDLASLECIPCRGGVKPLAGTALDNLLVELGGGWQVIDGHHLAKQYRFADFASALGFVNRVGTLAEDIGHHPDLHLAWGKVEIEIWTHAIGGLHQADFVFAARCDRLVSD